MSIYLIYPFTSLRGQLCTSSTIEESSLLMPCEFSSSFQFYGLGSIVWTTLWSGLAPNMH